MRTSISALLAVVFLTMGSAARADTAWSSEDYALHPGDFNGDGFTDMLYVARDPAHLSGIALSDGSGFNTPLQSWGNAYLGIPWSDGLYTLLVADFNGDGKDDLFLQRNSPGDHYLLLAEEGGIGAISQTVPNDAAGLDWSAHHLVAGAGHTYVGGYGGLINWNRVDWAIYDQGGSPQDVMRNFLNSVPH